MFPKQFNFENKFFEIGTKAADLIIVSILWVICSIPLVTVGPACTAMYYVVVKDIRSDRGNVWRDFFMVFRREFRQSAALMMLYTGVAGLVIVSSALYRLFGGPPNAMVPWILKALLIPVLLTLPYGFAVIARFQNTFGKIIYLASILSFRHILYSVVLVSILGLGCMLVYFRLTLLIFMPGMVCISMSFLTERVFKMHVPEESQKDLEI